MIRRNIIVDIGCLLYIADLEINFHILCDCSLLKAVWLFSKWGFRDISHYFSSIGDWFNMLLQQIDKDDIEEICCVMWALWKSRNSIMVKNERMNLIQVVQLEYDMYTWYKVAIFVERSNQLTTGSKGNWWSCLARTKLNYDLAIFELNGERWVGSSFIIKNSNGKLVRRLCLIQMLCWLS